MSLTVRCLQVEISPSYFGVKPEDLNVHAAAAREDTRPMPSRPVGHVRGHTGMHQKVIMSGSNGCRTYGSKVLCISCFREMEWDVIELSWAAQGVDCNDSSPDISVNMVIYQQLPR